MPPGNSDLPIGAFDFPKIFAFAHPAVISHVLQRANTEIGVPGDVILIMHIFLAGLAALILLPNASAAQRPDGLYAEIRTSKGLIVARLEPDLTPLAVANFVGLAEGAIANSAFDPGRPFFDGTVWHRVVPGHVIQTGIPQSDRAKAPGYSFPNEVHAKLSHN